MLTALGFDAIATTSGGFAATLGPRDGSVSLEEVLAHCETMVAATALPLSADFENGFADSPEAVAASVRRAAETGLAGASIEDFTGRGTDPIYDVDLAAAESAHRADAPITLTARAENFLHGPISPTRSPGCSASRPRAPTHCSRPGSWPSPTSAAWSARSTSRSTC